MTLSIIIPAYNAESTLRRCLLSVQNQLLADFECIVVDDGSTDKTLLIASDFATKDSRFKVYSIPNSGVAHARNFALDLAKGEWVSFVDADDTVTVNRFSTAVYQAENNKVEIVQCSINVFKNGKFFKKWHLGNPGLYSIDDNKILTNPLYDIGHCWDKVYKRSLLSNNGIRFYHCDMAEDTLFNIEAYCQSGTILSIAESLCNYYITPDTLSHSEMTSERTLTILKQMQKLFNKMENNKNFQKIKTTVVEFLEKILLRCPRIDYVFPYVDNTKEQWIEEYSKYRKFTPDDRYRFRSDDLLKFKFRAIEKWMPWVGIIHFIVSDSSQVPSWVDTSKVNVVYHKDFIPSEYLPTFNSCTIEMFLHKIFGLSEKFIYSNDDVFPNSTLIPQFFFEKDKLKADLFYRKLWHKSDIEQPWAKIINNTNTLAAIDKYEFKYKYVKNDCLYELQHIGKPMFRSLNKYVFDTYRWEIEESISQFREGKNLNQGIYTAYALFHDRGIFATFKFGYFQIGRNTQQIVSAITEKSEEKRLRSICCNDTEVATDMDFRRISKAFLELYPEPCKYEIVS